MCGKMVHKNSRLGYVMTPGDLYSFLIDDVCLDLHCLPDEEKQANAEYQEANYWGHWRSWKVMRRLNRLRLSCGATLEGSQTQFYPGGRAP